MIVTDGELQKLIEQADNPLLTDYERPTDWKDKNSLVQPCSIDLHIGSIFQPGVREGKAGSAGNPKSELVLKTGQTAIVATKESIHLPADYAGYGFPPAHISSKALLMTNPGHIDPGYSGKLQFTVINMGREDYVLRSTDLIVTILIFKLDTRVDADYAARHPIKAVTTVAAAKTGESRVARAIFNVATSIAHRFAARLSKQASDTIAQSDIDRLSPDFVDVQRRATKIAKKWLGYSTVGASVLAVVLSWGVNWVEKRFAGLDEIKAKLAQLEVSNDNLLKELSATKEQLQKQIDIDHRLVKLEVTPRGH